MASLRLLLAASAIFSGAQLAAASRGLGCTRRDLAECMFPMTYQKAKFNLDYPIEMPFKEVCSKWKMCMDAYVTSCLDKESQDFYSEGGETLTRIRKEICGMTPLKSDITKHLNCWDTESVKQATEECNKVKHFVSQVLTSSLTHHFPDNVFAMEVIPQSIEQAIFPVCILAKLALQCTWPLLKECDLNSKDCLPGYLLQSANEYSTP